MLVYFFLLQLWETGRERRHGEAEGSMFFALIPSFFFFPLEG